MFDFHLHSQVSFDSQAKPMDMVRAAARRGLREICFTDHLDFRPDVEPGQPEPMAFTPAAYAAAYDALEPQGVTVHLGVEAGLLPENQAALRRELSLRAYDFVIGSVHFAQGLDPYYPAFWEGRSQSEAYCAYLQEVLRCLGAHTDFDVLGHLTYPSKARSNLSKVPYSMADYGDWAEEIFKRLITQGKGLEVNTSGLDCTGETLPPLPFVSRYVELGGEILTIGSDAHSPEQVGLHVAETLARLRSITPYICTFAGRRPVFHRIDLMKE